MTDSQSEFDSVFLHSRRETIVLLLVFCFFLVWCIGVSWTMGYDMTPEEAGRTVAGIPRWVFWGVCVPWTAATVFTVWFATFYIADDPLGEELDSAPASSDSVSPDKSGPSDSADGSEAPR